MSWKNAKEEAIVWLAAQGLPPDLKGREIDLNAITRKLPHKGQFRDMIVRAIARQLKARGAKVKQD